MNQLYSSRNDYISEDEKKNGGGGGKMAVSVGVEKVAFDKDE
jgi:hypothetical protein